jgi:hypothetical protein
MKNRFCKTLKQHRVEMPVMESPSENFIKQETSHNN